MSPASSGPLEVERYIGACLISSHSRSKGAGQTSNVANGKNGPPSRDIYYPRDPYDVYNGYVTLDNRYRPRRCNSVDGWAGGMPLISFASNQRRNRKPDVLDPTRSSSPRSAEDVQHSGLSRMTEQTPLSRLAVHTQGLPLILSTRHGNRRSKTSRGPPPGRGVVDSVKKIGECKDNSINGVDSLSVASDESSGSNNSENSLPRIIKPRKRRKKDRKPHPARNSQTDTPTLASSNIVTLKPYVPYCFDRRNNPVYIERTDTVDDSKKGVTNDVLSETPQLHHRFEDILPRLEAEGDASELSSCQCRYCDPAGQIWDIGRHCYSPILTSPSIKQSVIMKKHHITDRISSALQSQCLISTLSVNSLKNDAPSETLIQKHEVSERISSDSRSQCLISTFSLDVEDVAVVKNKPNRTQQCLEISTKIVTSPNGHRDLEIKLFATTSIDDDRPGKSLSKNSDDQCKLLDDKCSESFIDNDSSLTPEE